MAVSKIFFFGYVGLLIIAGAWGAFGRADLDQRWLMDLDVDTLPAATAASLLSQYRFLRAVELGFGVLAFRYRHEIYADRRFGVPYLSIMSAGVLARALSILVDGRPSNAFLFFMIWEAVGAVSIYAVARRAWSEQVE